MSLSTHPFSFMHHLLSPLTNWLETRWMNPAYAGWVLAGLTLFYFGAATNTLAGWLYVISGISLAVLFMAAVLPRQNLRSLRVSRAAIAPVSAGDYLTIELVLDNPTPQPKILLQVSDGLPSRLGVSPKTVVEIIPPHDQYRWVYYHLAQQRGVYRWQTVTIRTAAPLGLFWCRSHSEAKAKAIVYPTVLTLSRCPLIDEIGQDIDPLYHSSFRPQAAAEGVTKSLRPYRWGDPLRMIHWRSSARYGQLRTRELEVFTGGQEIVICVDTALRWQSPAEQPSPSAQPCDPFEQAVIAAASLYFYANRSSLRTRLWTASTGLLDGNRIILETLAAANHGEVPLNNPPPNLPLIWLTQNPRAIADLPPGSRWLLWPSPTPTYGKASEQSPLGLPARRHRGLIIHPDQALQTQLQSPLQWPE